MTYNFDHPAARRHTGSYKWDIFKDDDIIPLWVADMDFETAPCIAEAVRKRAGHSIYGYTLIGQSYYDAIINWFSRRHNWHIEKDWIIYTTGVVPAISATIKALTLPGEKVLVQTPVYNCFFSSIRNQGCQIEENELVRKGDSYVIDFEDFERRCADEKVTVFLLCNPHNPTGRMWTHEELERMNDICLRHGVKIISDEIHCELAMPGETFSPMAAISDACRDNCVTLNSPSKSFNTAGLQIANIICCNPEIRRRIDRVINIYELCDVNPFGPVALEAAYNNGEEWLDSLNNYISGNYELLKTSFAKDLPEATVIKMEATYLAWIDISRLGITSEEACRKLLKDGKVYVNSGTMYGRKAGEGYIRINLACPHSTLKKGIDRITSTLKMRK